MKLTCTCLCNISQMCQNLGLENLTWDSNDCILQLHKNIEADLDCDTRATPPHLHSLLPWKVEQLVLLLIHHQAWHTCTKNRIYFIYFYISVWKCWQQPRIAPISLIQNKKENLRGNILDVRSKNWLWKHNFSDLSATLVMTNLALLIPCMEFEIFCGQIPSFEVLWICHYYTLSISYLSLFQIQNLCQFCAKRWFSQKGIHTAFPFLILSVLLSC